MTVDCVDIWNEKYQHHTNSVKNFRSLDVLEKDVIQAEAGVVPSSS